LFRKRVSPEEVPYLGSSPDPQAPRPLIQRREPESCWGKTPWPPTISNVCRVFNCRLVFVYALHCGCGSAWKTSLGRSPRLQLGFCCSRRDSGQLLPIRADQNAEMPLTEEPARWSDKQYRCDIQSVKAAAKPAIWAQQGKAQCAINEHENSVHLCSKQYRCGFCCIQ
jgi:hypothetical protein